MSSRQKALMEEIDEENFKEHCARLENQGIPAIADKIEDMLSEIKLFERERPSLTRLGWARIDSIKELLTFLK